MKFNEKYRRIVIVSAMPVELDYLAELLDKRDNWKKVSDAEYTYDNKVTLYAEVVGAGKVSSAFHVAEIVKDRRPELVVNVGYAGGLVKDGRKGDIAIGREYVQADFYPLMQNRILPEAVTDQKVISKFEESAEILGYKFFTGKIATGDFFLHNNEDKERIIKRFSPIAFDMESAAIAQVAAERNFEFAVLRTFSDMADDNAEESIIETSIHNKETAVKIEKRPIEILITAIEM